MQVHELLTILSLAIQNAKTTNVDEVLAQATKFEAYINAAAESPARVLGGIGASTADVSVKDGVLTGITITNQGPGSPVPQARKKPKASEPKPDETKASVAEAVAAAETEAAAEDEDGPTYDQVKDMVFQVAKTKGREASLDLLAPFGVVTGEGDTRKGDMTKLMPNQYKAVVIAANRMLD